MRISDSEMLVQVIYLYLKTECGCWRNRSVNDPKTDAEGSGGDLPVLWE